jgi:cytochrome c peroxidase
MKKTLTMRSILFLLFLTLGSLFWGSCKKDPEICSDCLEDLEFKTAVWDTTPYLLNVPTWLPKPIIPADNTLTMKGVALGRRLFYDPILSKDSTQSCSSCHSLEKSFTDGLSMSIGERGLVGTRSSMALVNLAYNTRGFFWDGRVNSLEIQVLHPIEDPLEMNNKILEVELRLRRSKVYPRLFKEAFGVSSKSEITIDLLAKAIAQFERTLISGNSRYDQLVWGQMGFPNEEEVRGIELFFIEFAGSLKHPGCSHCHFNPLFTDNQFRNNGLDYVASLLDFKDPGRRNATQNINDSGKFRVPTLRNIALTAPYMHDGRFKTLEEVLVHYEKGGHGVINEDPNLLAFKLSDRDKKDLIAFLKMLTDTSFINNKDFSKPF